MTDRELMQQALEVLKFFWDIGYRNIAIKQKDAMDALQERLEQPEQKSRQWQGLTDEELNQIYAEPQTHAGQYARAIEVKLKEKNT